MSGASQPIIHLTRCAEQEFYRLYTPGMAGFTYNMTQRSAAAGSIYIVARQEDGLLAGFAKILETPDDQDFYISYIEVRETLRGQGLSATLLGEVFQDAARNGKNLTFSGLTEMGQERLKGAIGRLQKSFPGIILSYE